MYSKGIGYMICIARTTATIFKSFVLGKTCISKSAKDGVLSDSHTLSMRGCGLVYSLLVGVSLWSHTTSVKTKRILSHGITCHWTKL